MKGLFDLAVAILLTFLIGHSATVILEGNSNILEISVTMFSAFIMVLAYSTFFKKNREGS